MNELTFEQLPYAVNELSRKIEKIESLILEKNSQQSKDKLLTVQEVAKLLKLAPPTIYAKVSDNTLPFMKQGKRLYFLESDIIEYLKQSRNKTNAEIEEEATSYIKRKGGKK